jgi:hypothetical protein
VRDTAVPGLTSDWAGSGAACLDVPGVARWERSVTPYTTFPRVKMVGGSSKGRVTGCWFVGSSGEEETKGLGAAVGLFLLCMGGRGTMTNAAIRGQAFLAWRGARL